MEEKMRQDEKAGGKREAGLLEMIDSLIIHMNEETTWFNVLIITSILVAPISLFFTLFLLFHRRLVMFIFMADALLGTVAIFYFGVILVASSLWLIIGMKEYAFLTKWNNRFRKYFSLKEKLDNELRKEFGDPE